MPEVVVQYGKPGFVGRFLAAEEYPRGSEVVVRTPRGLERGVVFHSGWFADKVSPVPDGEVERGVSPDDSFEESSVGETARRRAEELDPVTLWLDSEELLDGTILLHIVPLSETDLTLFVESVAATVGRQVRLFDVSTSRVTTDPPTTCGKPDCGTGKGKCDSCGTGCSTGSCSRKAVKNADELTAYFADLRTQMESRRTPLVT